MILAHYSASPLIPPENGYDPSSPYPWGERRLMKPHGLWVSVDDAEMNWQEWCCSEKFGLDRFAFRTEVKLKEPHNIKIISSAQELDAFRDQYGFNPFKEILPEPERAGIFPRNNYINWEEVAKDYGGLIITPYLWERRFDGVIWYYSWDCASGCLWDINSFEIGMSEPFSIDEYDKKWTQKAAE